MTDAGHTVLEVVDVGLVPAEKLERLLVRVLDLTRPEALDERGWIREEGAQETEVTHEDGPAIGTTERHAAVASGDDRVTRCGELAPSGGDREAVGCEQVLVHEHAGRRHAARRNGVDAAVV